MFICEIKFFEHRDTEYTTSTQSSPRFYFLFDLEIGNIIQKMVLLTVIKKQRRKEREMRVLVCFYFMLIVLID